VTLKPLTKPQRTRSARGDERFFVAFVPLVVNSGQTSAAKTRKTPFSSATSKKTLVKDYLGELWLNRFLHFRTQPHPLRL
jgi:hypothetical protein